MKAYTNVDEYIAASAKEVRPMLVKLRRVIQASAPKAKERISYGIPFYEYGGTGYQGRLIYFAAFKKHISVFIAPRHAQSIPAKMKKYHIAKATYQFPLHEPFPFELIGDAVKLLVKEREQ